MFAKYVMAENLLQEIMSLHQILISHQNKRIKELNTSSWAANVYSNIMARYHEPQDLHKNHKVEY